MNDRSVITFAVVATLTVAMSSYADPTDQTARAGLAAAKPTAGQDDPLSHNAERADRVLKRLMDGNKRFAEDHPKHPHERKSWREKLSSEQHPVACILGCSDSRVPPELLFDQGFGDLFVVRVAGNVVDTDVTASIEYATDHLDVPLVVVLGHEGCGAVAAALSPQEAIDREPLEIHKLIDQITPACCDKEGHKCPALEAVEHNVEQSVKLLSEVQDLEHGLAEGHFRIVGAVYSLETGRVRLLETAVAPAAVSTESDEARLSRVAAK